MWLEHMPAELVIDILTRLPVKTLLRCTIVCKSWYSLITSPYFTTSHLNRTISNNQHHLLIIRHCIGPDKHSDEWQYSLHWDNDTFDEFAELDSPLITTNGRGYEYQYLRIVGTCNGLVCLVGDVILSIDIMALWNHSLQKSLILPKPLVFLRNLHAYYPIGFGIDPITNDYKVVRLTYLRPSDRVQVLGPRDVELFELSTGSWRKINGGDFSYVILPGHKSVFLNGVFHWAGYNPKYKVGSCFHPLIVSFDMRNDTLGVVTAPPFVHDDWDWQCARFTVYGELLSFFHHGVDRSCCLWVMKEYGVGSSWTKLFTIDLGRRYMARPLCCRENGDILFEKRCQDSRDWDLVSYDPKSKLIKNLEILGASDTYLDAYKYNESLVLTKGLNDLGRKENAVAVQGKSVLHREDDEVNGKITQIETKMKEELQENARYADMICHLL